MNPDFDTIDIALRVGFCLSLFGAGACILWIAHTFSLPKKKPKRPPADVDSSVPLDVDTVTLWVYDSEQEEGGIPADRDTSIPVGKHTFTPDELLYYFGPDAEVRTGKAKLGTVKEILEERYER